MPDAFAHVSPKADKAIIQKFSGVNLIAFMYPSGPSTMVTGYDHLLFLLGWSSLSSPQMQAYRYPM